MRLLALSLAFEEPAWLLVIALSLPLAVIALRWFASMSRIRRWSAIVTRSLLVALVAVMLAGASTVRQTSRLAVVAVVDVSGSVRRFADGGIGVDGRPVDPLEAARDFVHRAMEARGEDDLVGIVVFDGESVVVATPTGADVRDRSLDYALAEGSNLERAMRLGAAMLPSDASGRLILISDGRQTTGDALTAAREISARVALGEGERQGLPIDVIPLAYNVRRETLVESVDAPPRAVSGATVSVRVALRSTQGASGVLHLTREGQELDISPGVDGLGRRLTLAPGRHVEIVEVELEAGKIHRFEAMFEPDRLELADGTPGLAGDTHVGNNVGQAFTLTPGAGSVLVLDGVGGGNERSSGGVLADALRREGVEVDLLSPEALPESLLALHAYDLIVLQNVPAEALSQRSHELLVSYVRDLGGGMVMVGGKDSFGAGGWNGTALEPVLPVKLDLPDQLVVPEAAIVFVLDNSGSMNRSVFGSSRSQQQIANESAALAVQTLDKKDLVSVIAFNSTPRVVVPLTENDDPERISGAILGIGSGGGTNIGPALLRAREQLQGVDAKIKHVIVLTDGRSHNAGELPGIAASMLEDDIKVSTIAVGDDADSGTLQSMASMGGGVFYNVINPMVLPRIFVKAVRVVRNPLVREVPFNPVVLPTGSPIVQGLSGIPRLNGLVLTQGRTEDTVINAMATPSGEPLLAYWNVELGKVAAFTSDAHYWAHPWLDWNGYARFWTQLVRTIARSPDSRLYELQTDIVGDELRVLLDAFDESGRPLDLLTVPATVYAPDGTTIETSLSQTGPGMYESSVPARESGSYVVVIRPSQGTRRLAPVVGGASVSSGIEFRQLTSDVELLRQIATATGGRVLDFTAEPEVLFDRSSIPVTRARTPIWRHVLALAVLVLLLDIGTRRIAWDRWTSREFGVEFRKIAEEATADRGGRASATLGRLRGHARTKPTGDGTLGDADAEAVSAAELDRRRKARRAAAEALRVAREKDHAAPIEYVKTKKEAPDAGTAGDLLAAKRRARERYGSSDEDGAT